MNLRSIEGALKSAKAKAERAAEKAGVRQKLNDLRQSASAAASKAASTALGELKACRDYQLSPEPVACGGSGGVFAVYDGFRKGAKADAQDARVSVWLLDKRALSETYAKDDVEELLALVRKDASQWLKLRHPNVLRVHAPLEENRNALALVTEPVLASLADVLDAGAALREKRRSKRRRDQSSASASSSSSSSEPPPGDDDAPPAHLAHLRLSKLEIKHGILQLADALAFLHAGAGLVHRALSPETVAVTSAGGWKLAGGFGHAASTRGDSGDAMFHLETAHAALSKNGLPLDPLPLTPKLAYLAPELVLGAGGNGVSAGEPTPASDVFSLGAMFFELLAGRKWLEIPELSQTVGEYRGALAKAGVGTGTGAGTGTGMAMRSGTGTGTGAGLGTSGRGSADAEATALTRSACAEDPSTRPDAAALKSAAYFSADPGLRAIHRLDRFIELDVLGRAAFLRELQSQWDLFDSRTLVTRVLPPLLVELRTPQLQPLVLPIILQLCERQEPRDFSQHTLPHLAPLLETATGATLGAILRYAGAFAERTVDDADFEARVLPAVLRGMRAPEVLVQEEALRQIVGVVGRVGAETMRRDVVPRLHAAASETTAAAVRVNALMALGKVAPGLGPPEWNATLDMLHALTKVDHSAATLMCVLGVADAIGRAAGGGLVASRVLPLCCPLTLAPGLNRRQLATALGVIRGMLDRLETERMPGLPEAPPSPAPTRERDRTPPSPTAADAFAATTAMAASTATSLPNANAMGAATNGVVRPLAPPPGFRGGDASAADQLAAALSSPDDLASLFTATGVPPRRREPNANGTTTTGDMFEGMRVNDARERRPGGGGSLL